MRSITTIQTVVGTKAYDYPSNMKDLYDIILLDNSNSRKLEYIPYRTMHQSIPYQEMYGTGRPRFYTDIGNKFYLHRIPGDVYTMQLYISSYPSSLVNSDDTPSLTDKDDLIIACSTMFGLIILREDKDTIRSYSELFNMLLTSAVASDPKSTDWIPVVSKGVAPSKLGEYWRNPLIT
jgi:hypothetical protein